MEKLTVTVVGSELHIPHKDRSTGAITIHIIPLASAEEARAMAALKPCWHKPSELVKVALRIDGSHKGTSLNAELTRYRQLQQKKKEPTIIRHKPL